MLRLRVGSPWRVGAAGLGEHRHLPWLPTAMPRTSLGGHICPLLHAPGTPVLSPTPQWSHRGPSSGDSTPCAGGFAGGKSPVNMNPGTGF